MTGEKNEIMINANGLARTEQVFKTLDKYLERIHRRIDKIGRMRVSPMVRLTDRVTPQLERINGLLNRMNGQVRTATNVPLIDSGAAKQNNTFKSVSTGVVEAFEKVYVTFIKSIKNFPKFSSKMLELLVPDSLKRPTSNTVPKGVVTEEMIPQSQSQSMYDSNYVKNLSKNTKVADKIWGWAGNFMYGTETLGEIRNWINSSIGGGDGSGASGFLNSKGLKTIFKLFKIFENSFKPVDAIITGFDVGTTKPGKEMYVKVAEYIGGLLFGTWGAMVGSLILPVGGSAAGSIAGYAYGEKAVGDIAEDPIKALSKSPLGILIATAGLPYLFSNRNKDKPDKGSHFLALLMKNIVDEMDRKKKWESDGNFLFRSAPDKVAPPYDGYLPTVDPVSYSKMSGSSTSTEYSVDTSLDPKRYSNLPNSSGPTAVNVNLPAGAIQLSFQGTTEPNYEELSTYIGNRIATAIQQTISNRDVVTV